MFKHVKRQIEDSQEKIAEVARIKFEIKESYKQNVLNILASIERNTANLNIIIEIVRENKVRY